ncbi:VanW family protein [Rhodococcus sp. NPDC060090]|uniref:VanW family protein n=1 Tax=Rhodococcus sp. NPDC060090 TaxID=3347056 RepID=UPI003669CC25
MSLASTDTASEAPTTVIPVVKMPSEQMPSEQKPSERKPSEQNPPESDAPTEQMPQIKMPPASAATTAMPPASPPAAPPPPAGPPPVAPPPGGGPGGPSGPDKPWSNVPKRTVALVVGGVAAVLAVLYVADLAMSSGEVPRGVTVAGVEIGGESRGDAEATLREELGSRLDTPVAVTAGDTSGEIVPSEAGLAIDWDATLARVGEQPLNPFTRLASFFGNDEVGVVSTRDDAALAASIDLVTAAAAHEPREGNIVFEDGTPVPVTPQPGQRLDAEAASDVFAERWPFGDVSLPVESVDVTVTREGLDRALAEIAVPAVAADLSVTGLDGAVATLPRQDIGAVLSFAPDGSGGLDPQYHPEAAIGILAPQLEATETEPKDAQIVLDGGRPSVVPGTEGNLVDWEKTLESLPQLLAMEEGRTVEAVYESADPKLTTEAAEKLGINEVIGEFTSGGFEYASGVNIRLAAGEINGALVKPGETFSLNGYTGPRGAAEGYVESGIIEAGRPGKAVGGGISQLATTLYNASYFAGMEDVDHTEHSYYISRYPAAREATVYEGAIDLAFRNPSETTGVLIQTIWTPSDVTVRLWGTKTVDVQSITGDRTNYTSPNTITLPAGEACIPSSGAQGFTVTDTRIVTDAQTGTQVSNKTRTVRYDPVPVVKCVSPEPKPGEDEPAGADRPSAPASAPGAAPAPAPAPAPAETESEAPAAPETEEPAASRPSAGDFVPDFSGAGLEY